MAIVSGILLLITLFLGIPGIREKKELIDKYYLEEEKEPFFYTLLYILRLKGMGVG